MDGWLGEPIPRGRCFDVSASHAYKAGQGSSLCPNPYSELLRLRIQRRLTLAYPDSGAHTAKSGPALPKTTTSEVDDVHSQCTRAGLFFLFPSWAPTIVTCKAEDQTVTAPSAPVMPPKFRPFQLKCWPWHCGLTRRPEAVLAPIPVRRFPGNWVHQAMNDKLRRVARVVEKGLAPRWKPHLYWTSIWVHPGISRGWCR